MIPAFLAAYTGRDINGKNALDLFPGLLQMLPNWRVTYNGLSKLDWFKKYFKSFNINHTYRCTYAIGSYNTFQTFTEYMDGYGFVEDVQTGLPTPSSMYDISTVSINEQFSPLIGIDMTFHARVPPDPRVDAQHGCQPDRRVGLQGHRRGAGLYDQ